MIIQILLNLRVELFPKDRVVFLIVDFIDWITRKKNHTLSINKVVIKFKVLRFYEEDGTDYIHFYSDEFNLTEERLVDKMFETVFLFEDEAISAVRAFNDY